MEEVSPNMLSESTIDKNMLHSFIVSLAEDTPVGIECHIGGTRLTFIYSINAFVKEGPNEELTFFRN